MRLSPSSSYLRLEHTGERDIPLPTTKLEQVRLLKEWGLDKEPQECIWILAYDSAMVVQAIVEVGRGTHLSVDLHLPTALAVVLTAGSERFMLIHNHPGGRAVPSTADLASTKDVMEAANTLGLYFEDHIILASRGGWFSFAERGQIPTGDYAEAYKAAST